MVLFKIYLNICVVIWSCDRSLNSIYKITYIPLLVVKTKAHSNK